MNPQRSSFRRRETFLALALAVGLACLLALYFLLVAGQYFLAVLIVLASLVLLGCLQYLVWGRPMSHTSPNRTRTNRAPR